MEMSSNFKELRKHERASVQTIVVGMLNSGESIAIGSVADISLGGVKFTSHEFKMAHGDSLIHSIDLIAENHNLVDIPCEYVWAADVETQSDFNVTNIKQFGIQFGTLTPNQNFLLKNFINLYASLGTNNSTSNDHITYN